MPISASGAAWELQRNDEQAMAYTRIDKVTGLQVCRVETVMKTSLNALVAAQRDASQFSKWMEGVKSSAVVQEGDDFYVTHTLVPSPWPVKDRDSVVRSNISQLEDGSVTIEFSSVEGVVPPQKNYERVLNVKGGWCFSPLSDGRIRVEYEVMVDPGGKLPAWLVNRFALDVPYNTIKALHKVVKDPRYQNAKSWIREPDPAF